MGLDNAFAERESQARAAAASASRGLDAKQAFEHARQQFRRHGGLRILKVDLRRGVHTLERHAQAAVGIGVTHRIFEQVVEKLTQPVRIAFDEQRLAGSPVGFQGDAPDGEAFAKDLRYAPLPADIVKRAEAKISSITAGGKPLRGRQ